MSQPSPQSSLESSKQHAIQAAEELRAAAGAKAQQLKDVAEQKAEHFRDVATERTEQFRGYAEQSWQDARDRAYDWKSEGEKFVRDNPTKAVLYAMGVGFVVGLILRR